MLGSTVAIVYRAILMVLEGGCVMKGNMAPWGLAGDKNPASE